MARARQEGRREPGSAPIERSRCSQKPKWRSSTSASRAYTDESCSLSSALAMAL